MLFFVTLDFYWCLMSKALNMKSLNLLAVLLIILNYQTFAGVHYPAGKSYDISDRHLSGFNAVDAGGSFDVYITQGATESVKVDAPANVMSYIITEVKGSILKLYDKNDNWHWSDVFGSHRHIAVYVTAKNLNAISTTGSGDIFFKNGIRANSLRLNLSGSGDIYGKLSVKVLESTLSGSGDLHISGNTGNEMVEMSGSGDYHARDVQSATAAVRLSGSGDAYLNVSNKLDASTSGSGDVHYTGSVRNVSSFKTGSGDVERD